jgi:hypothetical protein
MEISMGVPQGSDFANNLAVILRFVDLSCMQ